MKALAFALVLSFAAPAAAEVVDVTANGLQIRQVVKVVAAPEKIWPTLIQPAKWWSSDHTFSGSAANMTLEAKPGGCWCESLPNGGGAVHMTVGHLRPPSLLVLRGSLGPFFNLAADGTMTYSLAPSDGGTEITLTFRAGGYVREGFEKWAPAIDGVLGQQMANLKTVLESGR